MNNNKKSIRMSYADSHPRASNFIADSADKYVKIYSKIRCTYLFCCYLLDVYIGSTPCII